MSDTIHHHLTDALLIAYSAGTLPEAFSLTAAAHVSLCDDCRARLGAFDSLGGALIETGDCAVMSDGSLDATLARIADGGSTARPGAPRHRRGGVLPGPVQDYVGGDLEAVRWQPMGAGVKQAILPTARGATARLLYLPAGASVPDHDRRGIELMLVLQGAYSDEVSRFGPGDIEVAGKELDHRPVADSKAGCLCLAAMDAPLRFKRLPPRLGQPFLRF